MAQPPTADRVRVLGTVTYDGPVPDPIPIPEAGTVRNLIEVDPKTKGLKDAVVWLEGASASKAVEKEAPEEPVVMVHDYHLYTCPGMIRAARPDAFLHHFVHIPWSQPDSWRVLPQLAMHPRRPSTLFVNLNQIDRQVRVVLGLPLLARDGESDDLPHGNRSDHVKGAA